MSDRFTEPQPFWRVGARTSIRAGPATFSSNLDYFTGGTLYNSVDDQGVTGMATASILFGSTQLRLSASGTRYLTPIERQNIVIDVAADHRLPFGHSISARVLKRASVGAFQQNDVIALLDYSIPLNLPTGGSGRTGTLTGSVRDAMSGAPLPNVIVQVGGRRVATDRNGQISVAGLEPGTHYIDLDRSTTGAARIASVTLPMRIELEAGQRRNFELEILPAGGITVEMSIVRANSASSRGSSGEPEPLERVVVDFHLGTQRIRRQSDSRGIIEVRDLRPGNWTVTIMSGNLPAFHRFDRDSVAIEVTSGSQSTTRFAATPVERRVEIVATADLVEERTGADPPAVARRVDAPPGSPGPRPVEPPILEAPAEPPLPSPALAVAATATRVQAEEQPAVQSPAIVPDRAPRPQGFSITVLAADRSLRNIAAMVYGNRDLWPRLWLANRDAVSDPDRLFAGQVLRIPPEGPLTEEERAIARRYPQN